jgi:predicted nucleotidyltransferase
MKAPIELWTVASCFGDLIDEVVFVGGMIRELLITDPAASAARPTQDVDCIVNAVSWVDYARLSEQLRSQGFVECTERRCTDLSVDGTKHLGRSDAH